MKPLIKIFCIATCYAPVMAQAHVLHIGDKSFVLNQNKTTSPALCIAMDDKIFYGALYTGTAPGKTLQLQRDKQYWLGQNCAAGTYTDNGITECTDCGIGHYCMGAMTRNPCTYGAISCRDYNHVVDAPMPAGAPINKFMNIDEVNEFIPQTDFSDWREISCCYNKQTAGNGTSSDVSRACATGTIGPGTYLFTARYSTSNLSQPDSINNSTETNTNAFIVVFDHPVGYATIHWNNVYQHFIDTEHAQYETYTMSSTPFYAWQVNKNETNISNLIDLNSKQQMCVYELK